VGDRTHHACLDLLPNPANVSLISPPPPFFPCSWVFTLHFKLQEEAASSSEVVQKVMKSHVEGLLGGKTLQAYHQAFAASEARKSPSCGLAAAELDALLDPSRKEAVLTAFVSEDTPLGELPLHRYPQSSSQPV